MQLSMLECVFDLFFKNLNRIVWSYAMLMFIGFIKSLAAPESLMMILYKPTKTMKA